MLSILSPAKTLDMNVPFMDEPCYPRFQKETNTLVTELKKYKPIAIGKLMHISDKLALLNADRYESFNKNYSEDNSRPAMLCFKGGVYIGMNAADFTSSEVSYAQNHIRILSGLYGLLRPLDSMQAYRLEMGTKLKFRKYKNLYEFWGDKITDLLQEDILASGSNTLINIASQEYVKAINTKKLSAKVIQIHFKEYKGDALKFISFNAKKARGLMARYIVKNNINKAEDLHGFDSEGYYFDSQLSDEKNWMFLK